MDMKQYIDTVIGPRVQADSGWLAYDILEGENLHLIAQGECAACPCLGKCLKWVEEKIAKDLNMKVKVTASSQPYIWQI